MSPRFRPPASPLQRLRLLCLGLALIALAGTASHAFTAPGVPGALHALIAGLEVMLGVHWCLGYRRGGFSVAFEPLEQIVVVTAIVLSAGDPFLALVAVLYRSLYGGPISAAVRTAGYLAALAAADLLAPSEMTLVKPDRITTLLLAGAVVHGLKLALDRVERSRRRLRAVLGGSSDVALIVGTNGRVLWSGESVRRVLGLAPSQIVGAVLGELVHPEDGARFRELLDELEGRPGDTRTTDLRIRDGAGRCRELETVATNWIHDPDVAGYVVNLRDAAERRRLDAARAALEAQRERQDLEARLQRSQRLQGVGQLAGGIAHDFNNLLAVILNYTSCLEAELEPGSPQVEDVLEIEKAARRGAALTRQLLLFGQRRESTPEVLCLNDVVAGMAKLLSRSLGPSVELVRHEAPALWKVEADVSNLEQVLLNLFVNARDAVGAHGTVTLTTENAILEEAAAADLDVPAGWYVRLSVADDGHGMDAETRERALEPFFTTKEPGTGTGLGLATIFGIVDGTGGGLAIDSEPGVGTRVDVYLPATAKVPPAADGEHEPLLPTAPPSRLLVVQEDPALRAVVERVLVDAGHTVEVASSGEEALVLVSTGGDYDLLLTDVVLTGISGPELADRVRAERPGHPVLLTSGYGRSEVARHGAGTQRVLFAPYGTDRLCAEVARAIARSAPVAA